jgi:hypothetical protein
MKKVFLWRLKRHDQGTEGFLFTDNFSCHTLELPWRDNQRSISCIPAGTYEVKIRVSPRYGEIYWVTEVENRTYILIHSGNYAGDTKKGYKTHVNGCILLGKKMGFLGEQRAILNSRITVRKFMNHMKMDKFEMTIMEAFYGNV